MTAFEYVLGSLYIYYKLPKLSRYALCLQISLLVLSEFQQVDLISISSEIIRKPNTLKLSRFNDTPREKLCFLKFSTRFY